LGSTVYPLGTNRAGTFSWTKETGPGTVTFTSSTSEDPNFSANQAGTYTAKVEFTIDNSPGGCTEPPITVSDTSGNIVVVEVDKLTCNSVESENTDGNPGTGDTVFVGMGASGSTVTIEADPFPSGDWPDSKPTWTNATAVAGQRWKATFPIDTVSASSSGTVVSATCGTSTKYIRIVVYKVASITPSSTQKVMISTMQDDTYPSAYQTEDRKITITATVTPVLEDVDIWFQPADPDDGSGYDPVADEDNNGSPQYGSLSYNCAETDSSGEAETVLTITDQYAGDNYKVEASQNSDFSVTLEETGLLVAWKRIYVEEDKMYKTGSDLQSDFTADGDSDPDTITVWNASYFGYGDTIVIFDADHPDGEERTLGPTDISGNNITVADLTNSYNAGYSSGDKGAAVGLPAAGWWDADISGRTDDAFGSAADGSDDGCFVEIEMLSDGENMVQRKYVLPTPSERLSFCNMWFENKDKTSNYIWVCGVWHRQYEGDLYYGTAQYLDDYCYIFLGEITHQFDYADRPTVNADVVAHEIGHQFMLTDVDEDHQEVDCHNGNDYCIMDDSRDRTDGRSEFCWDDPPNHLLDVRKQDDDI